MNQFKYVKLPARARLRGIDYTTRKELEMTGREWHRYAKAEHFRVSRDRDNRDPVANHCEVWLP